MYMVRRTFAPRKPMRTTKLRGALSAWCCFEGHRLSCIRKANILTSEIENEPETGSLKNTWHILPVVVQTCFAVTRQTSPFVPIHSILTHAFDYGLAVSNTYKFFLKNY